MNINGNTTLITGGGSGIGRGLAEAFHKAGNQVIVAGRKGDALKAVTTANPGMEAVTLDVASPTSIAEAAKELAARFRKLNVVIHSAGIMAPEKLTDPKHLSTAEAEIATNLLGPIRLNSALLPVLLRQPNAAILTISSGLAFLPMALTPTYCATKAAVHSYSQTLRWQLKNTAIQVVELIPPYVQTTLMGERQAADPRAMPLQDFLNETMQILKTQPNAIEVCVERVKFLRFAADSGKSDELYKKFNDETPAPID